MPRKKSSSKKEPPSQTGEKYGPEAQEFVKEEMHELKQGTLKSGRSGKKVKNPRQAIAIGLSKARKAGAKVPPPPGESGEGPTKKTTKKRETKSEPAAKTQAKKRKTSTTGGARTKRTRTTKTSA